MLIDPKSGALVPRGVGVEAAGRMPVLDVWKSAPDHLGRSIVRAAVDDNRLEILTGLGLE